jgi:hypothetical protein
MKMGLLLEFVQHHLLLGVQHVELLLPFGVNSLLARRVRLLLESFLKEGLLSLSFLVYSNDTASIPSTSSYHLELFQLHCRQRAVASHVGVWAVSDFLVVVNNASSNALSSALRGKCVGPQRLVSQVIPKDVDAFRRAGHLGRPLWVGEAFTGGGFRVRASDGLLFSVTSPSNSSTSHSTGSCELQLLHFPASELDTPLTEEDSGFFSPNPNLYASKYFPSVRAALRERGLDLLLDLPRRSPLPPLPDSQWQPFEQVYRDRRRQRGS